MTIEDLHLPRRVWINQASTLQPLHKYHGKVGIAVYDKKSKTVSLHFTEGDVHSMIVPISSIELKFK